MRVQNTVLDELVRNQTYESIRFNNKDITDQYLLRTLLEYFPLLFREFTKETIFIKTMKNTQCYNKLQKLVEQYLQISYKLQLLASQSQEKDQSSQQRQNDGQQNQPRKITRAAIARRNEKNQQQIRKDQIFVRLTPRSQSCIQFMLRNRNFPRIEFKLSCNQHLEYLVTHLTNKWIRGKVGYKILLYPDLSTFLKNSQLPQKDKVIKQPLNNYYMFTDIMAGCNVGQNGILNLTYEIVQLRKNAKLPFLLSQDRPVDEYPKQQCRKLHSFEDLSIFKVKKLEDSRPELFKQSAKCHSPQSNYHFAESNAFNKNSSFSLAQQQQSLLGQLHYHHSIGMNSINGTGFARKCDNLFSINSISQSQIHHGEGIKLQDANNDQHDQQSLPSQVKQEVKDKPQQSNHTNINKHDFPDIAHQDNRLGNLLNAIDMVQKQTLLQSGFGQSIQLNAQDNQCQSSRLPIPHNIKTITITKKRTNT